MVCLPYDLCLLFSINQKKHCSSLMQTHIISAYETATQKPRPNESSAFLLTASFFFFASTLVSVFYTVFIIT